MHPRVSLHQVSFLAASTSEFLGHCRELGVRNAVLVSPVLLAPGGADEAVRAAAECGISIESLNHPFATFPDLEGDLDRAQAILMELIALGGRLGIRSLYLLTGGRGTLGWEQAAGRFAEAIAPCVAAAEDRGIALSIENSSGLYADLHIAHTLADALSLAERARIGVCIELFACWVEAGLAALFRRAMPRCSLVQVSDYVLGDRSLPARAVPGDGVIPLERLIAELLAAGYGGVFDLELTGPRIEAEGATSATTRAARRLSEILTRLGA